MTERGFFSILSQPHAPPPPPPSRTSGTVLMPFDPFQHLLVSLKKESVCRGGESRQAQGSAQSLRKELEAMRLR